MFRKKPIAKPKYPIIGQCYKRDNGEILGTYIGLENERVLHQEGAFPYNEPLYVNLEWLHFSDNGKLNKVRSFEYTYDNSVIPCSSGGRRSTMSKKAFRRGRTTRKKSLRQRK